jgi:hypothetical protein
MKKIGLVICITIGLASEVAAENEMHVPALDEWEEIEEDPTSTPTQAPSAEEPVEATPPPPAPTLSAKIAPIPGGDVVTLGKMERRRLKRAERVRNREVRAYYRELRRARDIDPRGERELRLCSVNLNGYSDKDEVKRLIKEPGVKRLKKTEATAVGAIIRAGCDLVVMQGLVGRSYGYLIEKTKPLLKKLNIRSKVDWEIKIAASEAQTGFQGFLVRKGFPHQVETLKNLLIREPGRRAPATKPEKVAPKDIVPRDFFRLETALPRRGSPGEPPKRVIVISGIVAGNVNPFGPEPALLKAQIADVAIELVKSEQKKISKSDQPIILLVLERGESRNGVVEPIVTGRLRLDDFARRCSFEKYPEPKKNGAKKPLIADAVFSCGDTPPKRPQLLFNVLQNLSTVSADKQALPGPTSGIYLSPEDLQFVRKGGVLRFESGLLPIRNGLPGAALVWIDLNW